MAGISELIAKIGDENIEFQMLDTAMTNIKPYKGGSRVEFITEQMTPVDAALNTGKRCVMVWIEQDDFARALDELKIDGTK